MKNLREFIDNSIWIKSKTMPKIPHEFIVKDKYLEKYHKIFEQLVNYIQKTENGFVAKFFSRHYKYIDYVDYYYWTMGDKPEETILINRAKKSDYVLKKNDAGELFMEVNKENVL